MPDITNHIAALYDLARSAMADGHINIAAQMQRLANELAAEMPVAEQPGLFATLDRELHVGGGMH